MTSSVRVAIIPDDLVVSESTDSCELALTNTLFPFYSSRVFGVCLKK